MKRIVLIVPDTIIKVLGTSSTSHFKEIDVDRKSIIDALESNDYHETYFFGKNMVKVISIEDVNGDL